MKTAISIDRKLFDKAEIYSREAGMSRSKLYCTALNEYMQNNSPDFVTERLNKYYESNESKIDDDLKAAAYKMLAKEDW